MPLGSWNLEWLNANSVRSYPVAESATKTDVTGSFVLPDSFLLELYLAVGAGLAVSVDKFFVYSVTVAATGYGVSIGYDDGTDNPPVAASFSIDKASHVEGAVYETVGTGAFNDATGKIVVGDTTDIDLQPAGEWLFGYTGGTLDPDCVRPEIRGVSSVTVINGSDVSPPIYGDVQLVAGLNINIFVTSLGASSDIRIDAIEGAGLTAVCPCTDSDSVPIQTINGVAPDSSGNFNLIGDSCVDVAPLANGLKFTDVCSAPCCGDAELEALKSELQSIGDQAATLTAVINQLSGSVAQTAQVVLGSRLSDNPCLSC